MFNMSKSFWVTFIVTTYLVIYTFLRYVEVPKYYLLTMFALSPMLVMWMVITVLKDNSRDVQELEKEEEWGYQDKDKNTLGTF